MNPRYEVKDITIEDQTYKIPMRNGKLFQHELERQLISHYSPLSVIAARAEGGKVDIFGSDGRPREDDKACVEYQKGRGQFRHREYDLSTGNFQEMMSFRAKHSLVDDLVPGWGVILGEVGLSLLATPFYLSIFPEAGEFFSSEAMAGLFAAGFFVPFGIPLIHNLRPSVKERKNETKNYFGRIEKVEKANQNDLEVAIQDIRLYQGSMDEVAEDLETNMERLDTRRPETYLHNRNPFKLRVEAAILGADAVVHYQPGSSIGTPVRFVE